VAVVHPMGEEEEEDVLKLFADVEPIEQDDGPVPVVCIDYTPEFTRVMGYFRRVLVDGEHSARSLLLSAEVIDHNAANYTAWQYRRTCMKEVHKDSSPEARRTAWQQELAYISEQCLNNMKNYQVCTPGAPTRHCWQEGAQPRPRRARVHRASSHHPRPSPPARHPGLVSPAGMRVRAGRVGTPRGL
jgi:hypothetical protein